MGKAIRIYLGIDANVPVRVGKITERALKIIHSFLILLNERISKINTVRVDANSNTAFINGIPLTVRKIFKYL